MSKWLIRRNCEFSLMVEASTEAEALEAATDELDWDTACSDMTAEEAEENAG